MPSKLRNLMVIVSLCAGLLVVGCGGSDDEPENTTSAPAVTGPANQRPESTEKNTEKGGQEKTPAEEEKTVASGTIENPDDPASSRKAVKQFSVATAEVFNDRDPETFCEMIDPEFVEQQFDGNIEACEEQVGKMFAPNSKTLKLSAGRLKVNGERATMTMKGPNGQRAGVAEYVRRGDRWYLSLGPVEADGPPGGDESK